MCGKSALKCSHDFHAQLLFKLSIMRSWEHRQRGEEEDSKSGCARCL